MKDSSFQQFILDELDGWGDLSYRSMFGGFGLYFNGKFFGIIYDDSLFFKTDQKSRALYEEYGMKPFSPNLKQILKTYYEVPADILENREELICWADRAVLCAEKKAG